MMFVRMSVTSVSMTVTPVRVVVTPVRVVVTPVRVVVPSSTVGMTVMSPSMLKDKYSDEVDDETQNGDQEKSVVMDLGRFERPL